MGLRRRLAELLDDYGVPRTRGTAAALSRFLQALYAEDGDGADPAGEDEDDAAEAEDPGRSAVRAIPCPHCGERLDLALDLSGGDQDLIQDCAVCCSPIHVVYAVREGRLASLRAEPA